MRAGSPESRGAGGAKAGRGGLALTLFAMLGLFATPAAQAQIRAVVVDDPRPGQRAPALILPSASAGGEAAAAYDLTLELGRVVVLVFCRRLADPGCAAVWQEWSRPGGGWSPEVSLVGVSGDAPEVVAEGIRVLGGAGRLLPDDRLVVSRRWGAGQEGRVGVFVVNRDGVVTYRDLQFFLSEPNAVSRLQAAVSSAAAPSGGR